MQFTINNTKKELNKTHPGLYLVSTPIGNLEDITLRSLNILKKSDLILCEDTRRSSKLLFHYNISNKLIAYHKFNENKISNKIIEILKKNKIVSLISDAGTPTISDPGLILIKKCIDYNINIYPIPGPSAVTTAMSVSGFSEKYFFYGFLPKTKNELIKILKNLSCFDFSLIFFASANKINFYLENFKVYFPKREIFIAREMTKMHEHFYRSSVHKVEKFKTILKGEITIIISSKKKEKNDINYISESVKLEIKKMLNKYTLKDVVDFFSKKENLKKKMIYNYCLQLKK